MRAKLAATLLILAVTPAVAQIYKSTDADGNVVYTDAPPPNTASEQVELQHTNTAPPPPAMPRAEPAPDTAPAAPEAPRATITAPAPETTIPMGGGNFSVSAHVEPRLERGQALRLTIDGEPEGEPQPSGFWDLSNVFRGAHDLVVEVVDADGKVLSSSEPVRVYVMRPSVR